MLFNYLNYRMAALSTEVDEVCLNDKTRNYTLKIKHNKNKENEQISKLNLEINDIPEIISVNMKDVYKIPKYLQGNNIYNDKYIDSNTIWGFIIINNDIIPLIRLEYLSSEVICETHKS